MSSQSSSDGTVMTDDPMETAPLTTWEQGYVEFQLSFFHEQKAEFKASYEQQISRAKIQLEDGKAKTAEEVEALQIRISLNQEALEREADTYAEAEEGHRKEYLEELRTGRVLKIYLEMYKMWLDEKTWSEKKN